MATDTIPGDYNQDGNVDAADYVVWRKTEEPQDGYDVWRTHFGEERGSGSGAIASAAVPEPASLLQIILVAAVMFTPRRRGA